MCDHWAFWSEKVVDGQTYSAPRCPNITPPQDYWFYTTWNGVGLGR